MSEEHQIVAFTAPVIRDREEETQVRHILLDRAWAYEVDRRNLAPEACTYDMAQGRWVLSASGIPLVETPGYQGPSTKKCDIETGEDQKGE